MRDYDSATTNHVQCD